MNYSYAISCYVDLLVQLPAEQVPMLIFGEPNGQSVNAYVSNRIDGVGIPASSNIFPLPVSGGYWVAVPNPAITFSPIPNIVSENEPVYVTADPYYYFAVPIHYPIDVSALGTTYQYAMTGTCTGGFRVTYRSCRRDPACWRIYSRQADAASDTFFTVPVIVALVSCFLLLDVLCWWCWRRSTLRWCCCCRIWSQVFGNIIANTALASGADSTETMPFSEQAAETSTQEEPEKNEERLEIE
jgi:hypothetical protein